MIRSLKYLKIALYIFTFLYFIIEYQFEIELILLLVVANIVAIIINSVHFRRKEIDSIELGEKQVFRNSFWFLLIIFGGLFFFLYFVMPYANENNLFPEIDKSRKWFVPLLMLIPGLIENTISIILSETKTRYYATEKGLLRSLEGEEKKKWSDFYRYKVIGESSILRLQKKNLKYLIIKYEEDYFHENKEEIIAFLDKKLTRE